MNTNRKHMNHLLYLIEQASDEWFMGKLLVCDKNTYIFEF